MAGTLTDRTVCRPARSSSASPPEKPVRAAPWWTRRLRQARDRVQTSQATQRREGRAEGQTQMGAETERYGQRDSGHIQDRDE